MTTPGHGGRRSSLQRIQAAQRAPSECPLPRGAQQLAITVRSMLTRSLPAPEDCGNPAWRAVVEQAHQLAEERLDAIGEASPSVVAQVCTASLAQAAERHFWGVVADSAVTVDQAIAATGQAMRLGAHARKADLAAFELMARQRSDTRVTHQALTDRLHSGVAGTVQTEGESVPTEGVH